MAQARLTAAPEMGNIAHLAGLLGAVMPQRPGLWQAINVPRERQRESDWLALWWKVDLLPTPHWGTLWWMLPGCGESHWKGGEGTFLCITPVLDVPTVTQDGGLLLLTGPQEVVRQSQSYSHTTTSLCLPTGRQMERRPCHMLSFTKAPLDTLHPPYICHFKEWTPPTLLSPFGSIICYKRRSNVQAITGPFYLHWMSLLPLFTINGETHYLCIFSCQSFNVVRFQTRHKRSKGTYFVTY